MHMLHIVICGCPATPYVSTLSHKMHEVTEHAICDLTFSTFVGNVFHSEKRTERGIIKNVYRSSRETLSVVSSKMYIGRHVKHSFFCEILNKFVFSIQIFEKY
jgi:hypothetical protein